MQPTTKKFGIALLTAATGAAAAFAQAPLGTNFTYQGQLKEGGSLAAGTYDLRFRLFDAASGGVQIGATDCVDGVTPEEGLFTVELDFGALPFDGNARWLDIGVRSDSTPANCGGGAAYTPLLTRQPLTAVPYAMYALDGPGGVGGFWAANGSAIHNTNAGRVGIGTSNPGRVLHTVGDAVMFERAVNDAAVFLRNTANGTLTSAFGLKNTGASAGYTYLTDASQAETLVLRNGLVGIGTNVPQSDLHIFHPGSSTGEIHFGSPIGVPGISGFANNGNRRDIRFLDGGVGLYTSNGPGIPVTGNGITIDESGRVGIGTAGPGSRLEVVPTLGQWGVRVLNDGQNSAIYATSSGGASPTVYGVSSSTAASSVAIHGLIAGTTPGADSAGVRGTISSGSSTSGYGVYGRHGGSGYGVYGESLSTTGGIGVVGSGRYGMMGLANDATGFGGVFGGSGAFGGGDALWVIGYSHLQGGIRVGGGGAGSFAPPDAPLHVENGTDSSPASGGFIISGDTAAANISIDNNEIMARNNGATTTLFLNHNGGDVQIGQASGGSTTLYVPVIAITGADVAEKFPTSEARDTVKPGMVMEIDPANAGKLRIASGAYNRRVAGIVSGAGDIPVGAILGNMPGHEDAPAIALSGRVYVYCDASSGAIEPGDMLTTSDTAGHAMKVGDYPRAQGAIIGKAMSSLKQGETGLVLVLVNLQ